MIISRAPEWSVGGAVLLEKLFGKISKMEQVKIHLIKCIKVHLIVGEKPRLGNST
jgi:hypothetical protein